MFLITYLAEWTGLEPATPCVTGMYSNQLNYHSVWVGKYKEILGLHKCLFQKTYLLSIIGVKQGFLTKYLLI